MKKLLNLDRNSYPKSKFEKFMTNISGYVFLTGLVLFALVIFRLVFENTNHQFFNHINPVSYFFQNHAFNYKVIWSDLSPYLCLWLIFMCVLTVFAANNYRRSIRDEYLTKTTSKLIALNQEIDELKASNDFINEAFASYRADATNQLADKQKRIDYYSEKYDRKRDLKGHFLPKK